MSFYFTTFIFGHTWRLRLRPGRKKTVRSLQLCLGHGGRLASATFNICRSGAGRGWLWQETVTASPKVARGNLGTVSICVFTGESGLLVLSSQWSGYVQSFTIKRDITLSETSIGPFTCFLAFESGTGKPRFHRSLCKEAWGAKISVIHIGLNLGLYIIVPARLEFVVTTIRVNEQDPWLCCYVRRSFIFDFCGELNVLSRCHAILTPASKKKCQGALRLIVRFRYSCNQIQTSLGSG